MQNTDLFRVYTPSSERWYHFKGNFVAINQFRHYHDFDNSESHRPLLLRAGAILPISSETLPSPVNTHTIRHSPLELWVLPDGFGHASGRLYWDDGGESVGTVENGLYNLYDFNLNFTTITIKPVHLGYKKKSKETLLVNKIRFVLAGETDFARVTLDGKAVSSSINGLHLTALVDLDLLTVNQTVSVQILLQ